MNHFLDFEASSLNGASFPIEIAWIGESGGGEEHLIRPVDAWLADGCPGWSAESEALHGISLETLMAHGVPAVEVARMAVEALLAGGGVAYSDAPGMDGAWMARLLAVAGLDAVVDVRDVREAYGAACRPLLASLAHLEGTVRDRMEDHARSRARAIVARAEEAEARRARCRHRAWPDAESHWRVWCAIRAEVAQVVEGGTPPFVPPPLFKATFHGERFVVARARSVELEPLLGSLAHELAVEALDLWSLVALRREGGLALHIHALGWRVGEQNTWITSPVRVLDRTAMTIRTRSGRVYALRDRDEDGISPGLLRHLGYALRAWGYVDVRP